MGVYVNLKICDWQATPAIPKDTLNRKPAQENRMVGRTGFEPVIFAA